MTMKQRLVTAALALGFVVLGFVLAELPSLYKDLTFLHQARIFSEMQSAASQKAPSTAPTPSK